MRLKDRIFSISVRCSLMEKESLFLLKSGFISSGDSLLVQIWKKGSGESARA